MTIFRFQRNCRIYADDMSKIQLITKVNMCMLLLHVAHEEEEKTSVNVLCYCTQVLLWNISKRTPTLLIVNTFTVFVFQFHFE